MIDKLTILLTTKGREEYTQRFLAILNEKVPKSLGPLRVFIAEHVEDHSISRVIANGGLTNLLIERRAFGEESLNEYYAKIFHSLECIKTPYVMLADNDDLPQLVGIRKCVQFLEENSDYIGCTGSIPEFLCCDSMLNPSVTGPRIYLTRSGKKSSMNEDLGSESAIHRLRAQCEQGYSTHYGVIRTSVLMDAWKAVHESNPYLFQCELFVSLQLLILGKYKYLADDPSYARQIGNSQRLGYIKDYFSVYWTTQFCESAPKIYARLKRLCEQNSITLSSDDLEQYYANHYRAFLPLCTTRFRLFNFGRTGIKLIKLIARTLLVRSQATPELKLDFERIRCGG